MNPFRQAGIRPVLYILGITWGVAGCAGSGSGPDAGAVAGRGGGTGDAAVPVTIAAAVEKTVPLEVTTIGTGEPDTTVEVRAQVTGQLTAVQFTEGADVEQGQPLFTLDSRSFEAAVKQ